MYQLNVIIGMYVNEKRLIYRVRYYPRLVLERVTRGYGGTTVLVITAARAPLRTFESRTFPTSWSALWSRLAGL
jgi:hypothetical protein